VTRPAAAADDWDRHWRDFHEAARLNPAQDMRRRLLLRELRRLAPARLLDLGSGSGEFARAAASALPGAHFLGLEASAAGVALAREKAPGATFLQRDLRGAHMPEEPYRQWASAAVCSEVLEHVDDPRALLANAKPYLAPGAHLLVTVPGGPMSAYDRHLGHRRHFTRSSLRELIAGAGYGVEAVRGVGFPFFNLYRLVVIARGRRLIADADQSGATMPWTGRSAMRVFDLLFRLNLDRTGLGWQLVARARHAVGS